jgi:ketosteroid isomerase-like protein
MKKLFISLFVFSILFVIGCEQNQSTEVDEASRNSSQPGTLQKTIFDEIVAANQPFMEAFNNQNAEGMGAAYTQDAQLLPPNGDFVIGNQAVQDFWGFLFSLGFDGVILETLEVTGTGNTANEVGLFTLYLNGQFFDNGKYIVVWKKVAGKWYLHRDIWNSSNPTQ